MEETNLIEKKYLIGKASTPGDPRRSNEDRLHVEGIQQANLNRSLLVGIVADGVGSARGGRAAQLAIDTVLSTLSETQTPSIPSAIEEAIAKANAAVYQENAQADDAQIITYTTIVVGVVHNERLYVGNVGDSRAYWIQSSGRMLQITRDHTYHTFYGGDPNSEEAERVINVIGRNPTVEVDLGLYLKGADQDTKEAYALGLRGLPLKPGDTALLCSDGLIKCSPPPERQRYATDEEIADAALTEFQANLAATKMIGYPLGRNVDDNVSAVTIQYLSPELVQRVLSQTQRAKMLRMAGRVAAVVGALSLLFVAAFLGWRWLQTAQALAAEVGKPTATLAPTVIITQVITSTPVPTLKPTLPIAAGEVRVEQTTGVFRNADSTQILIDGELLASNLPLDSNDGGALLVFGVPPDKRNYLFIYPQTQMHLNYDANIIKPDLMQGALYVRYYGYGGAAEIHFPTITDAAAYVKDGQMIVQVEGQNISVWCFTVENDGSCYIKKQGEAEEYISAGQKRIYHADSDTWEDGQDMGYEEQWQWNVLCNFCLGEVVVTPTPTPRGFTSIPPTATPFPTATKTLTPLPSVTLRPPNTPEPNAEPTEESPDNPPN